MRLGTPREARRSVTPSARCHGALIGAIGIAAGAVAAAGLSEVLRSLVFRVSPPDPAIFGGVTLILGAVVLLAGYVPARRATRVEPLEALRGD